MNDPWLSFSIRIQSIAQAGLQYGKNRYDQERYREFRSIAAEMMAARTSLPVGRITGLFCNDSGYQTPKIDTRAAVFADKKFCWFMKTTGPGHCRAVSVM